MSKEEKGKLVVHYCAKCGKEMQYKDKAMLYLYDIVHIVRGSYYSITRPKKRISMNFCKDCSSEIESKIKGWCKE